MDFNKLTTISLLCLLSVIGCDSQPAKPDSSAKPQSEPTKAAASDKVSAEFICAHLLVKTDLIGSNLTLTIEDKSYQLTQVSTGSGSKYQNQANTMSFWQKNDSASLEFNGQHFSNCQKVQIQRPESSSKQLKLPFTARGNEPGWLMTVNKEQLELITHYGEHAVTASLTAATRIEPGQLIDFATEDGKLTLHIEAKICRDSMSGTPFPYTVTIKTQQETLTGCGGEPGSLLTKNSWSVLTIADNMLVENSRITLTFNTDMQLAGVASCNRYTTAYTLTGEGLSVDTITTTLMACEPVLMDQEASFLKHLTNITRFNITENGQLVLYTEQGESIVAQPG